MALAAFGSLAGCASRSGAEREPHNPDPFEPVNRVVYKVNDFGDRVLARPLASAYEKATPLALRRGANNFFDNLLYPVTILNDVLQGKLRQGGADLGRFVLNSTVGLFGVFDPATAVGLQAHDEDFGQTLVVWGLPEGPYLMLPFFGPYTVASAIGDLADTQYSPLFQVPQDDTRTALYGWYLVHTRYTLLPADAEVRQAFDPYIFVRDAYLQNRRFKIYDGYPPQDELYPEDDEP